MNKVFKTVWNASLGVWVAVSETAAGQKKGSNKLKKAAANAVATVVVGAAVASTGAMAYTNGHGTAASGGIAIGAENGSANAQEESVAIGKSAAATEQGAIAVGAMAEAKEQGTIAIGYTSKAQAIGAVAFGSNANAQGANSIALGTSATAQVSGTAVGKSSTAANKATAVGFSAKANSDESTAIGYNAKATGTNSVAINGTANGTNTFALGGTANGTNTFALGGTANGTNTFALGGTASGENAFALGGTAEGTNAFALGGLATADDTVAIGTGSTVSAKNSAAIGLLNDISGENTFVLGSNVSTSQINSVILGNQSVLSTVYNKATVEKADYAYQDVNGQTQTSSQVFNFAGMHTTNAAGAVSVGKKGAERQIQYVGAGRITSESTDAVNGSQLYYVLSEAKQAQADAAKPITFDDGKGGQATVKLGDTFNIEGATVNMVNGKPVLTVNAAEAAAWKLATGGDVTNASTIGGDTNVVDFVGGKNAEVKQTELKVGDKVIGTQLTVEVADQIELTENGGLTIAGVPELDPNTGAPLTDPNTGLPIYQAGKAPITINQGNINFGGNVLSGVAPGVAGTDAVNVNQLNASGWTIKGTDAANQAVTGNVAKDNAVDFKAGDSNNLTVNTQLVEKPLLDDQGKPVVDANGNPVMTHDAEVVVELANNIKLDEQGSLEFGAKDQDGNIAAPTTTLDAAGLTLAADQGKGAITIQQGNVSFGGNQLKDVAAGTEDTHGVNVSQLKDAVDTLGGGATVNPDGSINAPSYTVGAGDKTVNTVGDAIDVLNQGFTLTSSNATDVKSEQIQAGDTVDITVTKDKNLEVTQTGNKIEFALADDIQLTDQGALTIGNVPGTQIQIKQGDVSFGGNVLQNIGAGVNPTDAVNVSQLQSAGWNVITQDKDAAGNVTGTTENAVNGDKAANNSSVQFNGDKNISVSQTSKDVVDANGNVVGSETIIAVELDKDVNLSKEGSLTFGDTFLNEGGLTIAQGAGKAPIIINQGNVNFGGNVLGGVAAGVADDDAVNVSQLKDEIGKAVGDSGWTLTTGGVAAADGEKIKPSTTVDFSGDDIGNIQVSNEGSNVKVELNPNLDLGENGSVAIGDTLLDGNGLTVGDITIQEGNVNFAGDQLNNVGAATEDHQAVNLGQLKDELGGLENTINQNIDESIANSGWNLTGKDADGNDVSEKVNPNDTVEFVAGPSGNTTVTTETTPNGAKVTVDINDQLNLTGDAGSLTIGAGKGNDAITIQQGNVSVGGNQIHNLAAGTAGTDAVNVDQLKGTINIFGGGAAVNPDGSIQAPTYNVNGGSYDNVGDALGALNQADIDLGDRVTNLQQSFNNRIDDVEDRMSAGIAAAMALETAPYVPGKYTYAAATAYHNGQAALGVTLRKTADNGRWSLTGGVAAGTEGDPSVRLGVSGIID